MAHFLQYNWREWSEKDGPSDITDMRKVEHVIRLDRLHTVRSRKDGNPMSNYISGHLIR